MSRTILDPEYANSLNGLFNGETPINVASVNVGVSPSNVVLSANAPGSLLVGGTITTAGGLTAQNGNLTLGIPPAAVVLTGTTGTLSVDGTVNANAFGVGIGATIIVATIPELTSGAFSALPNQTITGFVGSSSSVYIATPLGGSVAGFNPYSFIAGFASTSGGNTTVYLSVSNLSGGTIPSIPIQVALLGVN